VSAHYTEDDLVLYYYREGRYAEGRARARATDHLDQCAECAAMYREISGTLAMIEAPEAPERGEQYGLEVWQNIRHRLPEPGLAGAMGSWGSRLAGFTGFGVRFEFVAAAAVLVVAAFVAGRGWREATRTSSPATLEPVAARALGEPANPSRRILLASVADHLDRSDRVLTDIMNGPDHEDISAEQRWAEDLLTASRLYRQDAIDAGEESVAGVLDELERSLIEIVHSPAKISAADLEQIRRRIDAAALLFKVRVMSEELRRVEDPTMPQRALPTSSTRKIS
jgi:hypothetical protein